MIPTEQGWFVMVGKSEGWKSPADFLLFLQKADFAKSGAAVGHDAPMTICLAAMKTVENRQIEAEAEFHKITQTGDLPIPIFQN